MDKVYRCKGDKPECSKNENCFKNGGFCHCTKDLKHAKVFVLVEDLDTTWYELLDEQ